MFRKTKLAAGVAGVAAMFLIAGATFSAVSANASHKLACTVQGDFYITSAGGITNTPAKTTGEFAHTTLTCAGSTAVLPTVAPVSAVFSSPAESCADSLGGSGLFTGGIVLGESVTGGTFTFDRVGGNVGVTGEVTTTTHNYPFVASLIFVPYNGVCLSPAETRGTTVAIIAPGSTVVIS